MGREGRNRNRIERLVQDDLAREISQAVSLSGRDLMAAGAQFLRLRRRALRVKDRRAAESCLVALRYVPRLSENRSEELRIARKLVAERGDWLDFCWLASLHHQNGSLSRAKYLYGRALDRCPLEERDVVSSALASL